MNDGVALTFETLGDIEVTVSVVLGGARRTIRSVLELREGSVVPLDVSSSARVQMLVNGVAIATGEIVELDDGTLAIEIVDVRTHVPGDAP